ncbi:MAG: glycosyltransferase family 39 protein, partial [Minisyncoccia bacterium]
MNLPNYKKWAEFITVLFVVLSGFCMTAFYKLNNFFTFPNLDELLWQTRSRIFWDKILQFDFSGLIQSAQPGITVYWFTGFMMKFIDFDFNYVNVLIAEKVSEGLTFNDVMNVNDQDVFRIYERVSFLFNLPLFLLTAVFFISFYYLLRKIGFNRVVSLFSLYFLVTNIFLTYWTTPSDKMLDIFMTLSLLTFLVYMNRRPKKKYLILSAVFGAWAALSKLTGLFVIPFYFFAYIFYVWPLNRTKLKVIFKDAFLWV